MNLFIDTTNWNLILLLEQKNKIIDQTIITNTKKVSDFFVDEVNKLLTKNNVEIKELEGLYVTTGPGSYTGVRIGLLFVRTLKTIDNHYQTYTINSLQFQAGTEKTISVLDARGGKFFVGVYDQAKPLMDEKLVTTDELNILKQEYSLPILIDYQGLDFAKNFLALKEKFQLVEEYQNLNPMYLKSSI